jgi:hypothetical protein
MKDILIILLVGSLLGILFFPHLGKAWDQEFGDYKKHNKTYNGRGGK